MKAEQHTLIKFELIDDEIPVFKELVRKLRTEPSRIGFTRISDSESDLIDRLCEVCGIDTKNNDVSIEAGITF